MAGLNPDQFLELYKLTVEEDHLFSKIYHDRTVFYQGILAALLAVTGAGFTTAEAVHEYVFLIVGPLLLLLVSQVAIRAVSRDYQRILLTITVRAKIEQELGMTTPRTGTKPADSYWQSEPFVPERHLKSRREFKSSDLFIEAHDGKGLHRWTKRLFRFYQIAGLALLPLLAYMACLAS